MFCISFVVVVVRSRLIGFDRSIEEAAADLGAKPLTTFRLVTFPCSRRESSPRRCWPSRSRSTTSSSPTSTPGTTVTFPLYIFGASLRGIPVQVNVLATMLFALTVVAIALVLWQQRRAEQLASVRPEQEA